MADYHGIRAWVVCMRCGRWNLAPIEERGPILEELQRAAIAKDDGGGVGAFALVILPDGVECVRLGGQAEAGAMAELRFGRALQSRRRALDAYSWLVTAIGVGLIVALVSNPEDAARLSLGGGVVAVSVALSFSLARTALVIRVAGGGTARVRGFLVPYLRLKVADHTLELMFHSGREEYVLRGATAVAAGQLVTTFINGKGARRDQAAAALRLLADAGGGEKWLKSRFGRSGARGVRIRELTRSERLALEIALTECHESDAVQRAVGIFQAQCEEETEIASIADELLLPEK